MYDVLVIGGGHAGVEAAAAAARIGVKVGLITMDRHALARLSCNPAMGGTAKGQLVREIDALGGLMGIATDLSAIQYRMLNRSKGPAVWSPRAQVDRDTYTRVISDLLQRRYPAIDIIEDKAVGLVTDTSGITGVTTAGRTTPVLAKSAILCSGTFLGGLCHTGSHNWSSGRFNEPSANELSESLRTAGFPLLRFKTGTPPRVVKASVNLNVLQRQDSDEETWFFSHESRERSLPQHPCWRGYTNAETHRRIELRIDDSPLFNGTIQSTGPRYCPSIEDKVVRFPDRDRHPLIFEPEGIDHPWLYVNGFSSSLPEDVQLRALRAVQGCEEVEIGRPGYAVEYDVVPSSELKNTFETRRIPGLYLAGQICGTSGYEEAAIQGLYAGANAALWVRGRKAFHLDRTDSYGGVLIDDLNTLEIDEPYRMFTSRAEYRLLLRQDNAEERLYQKAYQSGLIHTQRYEKVRERIQQKDRWVEALSRTMLPRHKVCRDDKEPNRVEAAAHLLKRADVRLKDIVPTLDKSTLDNLELSEKILTAAEIEIKYAGYLDRQKREIDRLREQEQRLIPDDFDYNIIKGISAEARYKLTRHRPVTLGQASRIAGVTPSDLAILLVYLKKSSGKAA